MKSDNNEKYYVYALRDKDGIKYVGSTKQALEDRYKQHQLDKKHSEKYLWLQNTKTEIMLLHECDNKESARIHEDMYIKRHNTLSTGFNRIKSHTTPQEARNAVRSKLSKVNEAIKKANECIEKLKNESYKGCTIQK